ncbi:MAG: hypothetical protein SFY69_11710 [Planctomycetota bacterium]|nr:hypothetical protein [Planctomycetota bacterium]
MNVRADGFGTAGRLRLIRAEDDADPALGQAPPAPPAASRVSDVARENHLAARLDDADVRAAFAIDVARAIEGGRAAVLRPENRRRLVAAAVKQGLREFDAHLVIAIVQDAARRAEPVHSGPVHARLSMLAPPADASYAWRFAIAVALAGAMVVGVLTWLLADVPG